jgi:hypothetical protein
VVAVACHGLAEEHSIAKNSTVLGQNYGYPSGTESPTPEGAADVVLETAFYLKNLEIWRLDPIQGETFIGFWVPVRFRYRPVSSVSVELGALLGHDFGDDDPLNVRRPIIRLAYEAGEDLHLIAGTLIPTHWMHDALLDDVQKFRTQVEEGFQFRSDLPAYKNDSWLNWRVREGPVRAEEFEFGFANQFRLWDEIVWFDGHLMWTHAGGQISSSDRLENNMVCMAGASVGGAPSGTPRALRELRGAFKYLYSRDDDRTKELETGDGFEVAGYMDLDPSPWTTLRLFGSVFRGDSLIARRGDPLYSLDRYDQLGISAWLQLEANFRIELGYVYQWTGTSQNYTFQAYLLWGDGFRLFNRGP